MRSFLVFLQFTLLLTCFFSCKRLAYDPEAYNDLLYKQPEETIPPKEYIFKTTLKTGTVGFPIPKLETSWNTTGTALSNEDTLTITGTNGDDVFTIKLKNYKNQSLFTIGPKRDTATLIVKIAGRPVRYTSKGSSHGKVTIVRFDNSYNQIEANFDMVLYNTLRDSIVISSGYFKINFSPNAYTWRDNGLEMKAQLISAKKGDFYEITGVDTLKKRAIVIKVPLTLGGTGFNSKIALGYNGTSVFYTDSARNYINAKAFDFGGVIISSISDNIIKGSFSDIRVGGSDANSADKFLDGKFSAKF